MTTDGRSVTDAFERALGEILTRVCFSDENSSKRIAVAYSGGLDSSVLLYLTGSQAERHGLELLAFHVHHGLSLNADAWQLHCERECARLNVRFEARRISVDRTADGGVEENARVARYRALGELCRLHHVPMLLTAHHQDDQAETVLLNLFRGAGIAGLAGMEACHAAPGLLGDGQTLVGRPLLGLARADLQEFAVSSKIAFVDDESNRDPRYTRNALRHLVVPVIEQYFPGFGQRVVRTAAHARAAQQVLDEAADADLGRYSEGACLLAAGLRNLSASEADRLLRHWLKSQRARMPSTARLAEMRRQLAEAAGDAQVCIGHDGGMVRRYRDRIYFLPRDMQREPAPREFGWNGEPALHFREFGGTLHFEQAAAGLAERSLKAGTLTIRPRQPGDRIKPADNRPSRDLKHHYQALDIPPWMRGGLPQICSGEKLLFSAGIGMNWKHCSQEDERCFHLSWTFD